MAAVQVTWLNAAPSTSCLVPVSPVQFSSPQFSSVRHCLQINHLQHYFPGAVALYYNSEKLKRLVRVASLEEDPQMLCIPSLSSSYFASDHQVEDLDKNLVGIVRDVEVVERELHSVVATLSDLASKLSELKVKTKELAAGCSNSSASLQPSTSSQPERKSKPALEAASRLLGEGDLDSSRVDLSSSYQVRERPVSVEGYKSQADKFEHQVGVEEHQGTSEQLDSSAGLERGKNPVCLLQELMVANNSIKHPTYHLVGEFGPGHSKIFQVYVEICLDSGTLRFTGSGSSMRKAKQAAASLALHEVGFKQFKTRQSRVEVGEGSSKAKEVGKILAKSLLGESGKEQRTSQIMSNDKKEVEVTDSAKVGSSVDCPIINDRNRSTAVSSKEGSQEDVKSARSRPVAHRPTHRRPLKNLKRDETPVGNCKSRQDPALTSVPNSSTLAISEVESGDRSEDSGSFEDTYGDSESESDSLDMTAVVKNRENELRSSCESANRKALDKESYGDD